MTTLVSRCGRARSRGGKPFTEQSLVQHQHDCPDCLGLRRHPPGLEDIDLSLTNLIADDDMSDGAYFALAWELGEL